MWVRASLALIATLSLDGASARSEAGEAAAIERALQGLARCARAETFVLERGGARLESDGRAEVVGLAILRQRPAIDGQELELDLAFLRTTRDQSGAPDLARVHQVECLTPRGPRSVWRELGATAGRTVEAEWSRDGRALDVREWALGATRRGTLVGPESVVMPLFLSELLRAGSVVSGSITVFDPLARTLEPLDVTTTYSQGERTVDLTRGDGTLFERLRFRGLDLQSFQWQEGGPVARRVERAEWDRLRAEHTPRWASPARRSNETRTETSRR